MEDSPAPTSTSTSSTNATDSPRRFEFAACKISNRLLPSHHSGGKIHSVSSTSSSSSSVNPNSTSLDPSYERENSPPFGIAQSFDDLLLEAMARTNLTVDTHNSNFKTSHNPKTGRKSGKFHSHSHQSTDASPLPSRDSAHLNADVLNSPRRKSILYTASPSSSALPSYADVGRPNVGESANVHSIGSNEQRRVASEERLHFSSPLNVPFQFGSVNASITNKHYDDTTVSLLASSSPESNTSSTAHVCDDFNNPSAQFSSQKISWNCTNSTDQNVFELGGETRPNQQLQQPIDDDVNRKSSLSTTYHTDGDAPIVEQLPTAHAFRDNNTSSVFNKVKKSETAVGRASTRASRGSHNGRNLKPSSKQSSSVTCFRKGTTHDKLFGRANWKRETSHLQVGDASGQDKLYGLHTWNVESSQGHESVWQQNSSNDSHLDCCLFGDADFSTTQEPSLAFLQQNYETKTSKLDLAAKCVEAKQACESWRLRGNQSYAEGDFSRAEECYTHGISCIDPTDNSSGSTRELVLCYSNRAASRMGFNRLREALSDCKIAMNLDPTFAKVQLRAASCHLLLGEYGLATKLFNEFLPHQHLLNDSNLTSEASEGIKKAKEMEEKLQRACKLLESKCSEDLAIALDLINEGIFTSPYSVILYDLKAKALLSLSKYEEAIKACEDGLTALSNNYSSEECLSGKWGVDQYGSFKFSFQAMIGRANFYLGQLDDALASLSKCEVDSPLETSSEGKSIAELSDTIKDLLSYKNAGNEAYQSGKYTEAEKQYTAALVCNNESRPFTAICFCNRAAAFQAQGHVIDAIADCNRAIAIHPEYAKAVSRRALLHENIQNYEQAIEDIRRLIKIQEAQQQKEYSMTEAAGSSSRNTQDLKESYERLAKAEENLKKGHRLDYYLILNIKSSSTEAEIKKAYRKAALKHHPDKAGQLLAPSDSANDQLTKVGEEDAHRDARILFQMIGEAYTVLSDAEKRLAYDREELSRQIHSKGTSKAESEPDFWDHQYERSGRQRHDGWNTWKEHEKQQQNWNVGSNIYTTDPRYSRHSTTGNMFRRTDFDWNDI